MANTEIYKLYQVIDVLVGKYNYTQVALKEYQNLSSNEAWLYNGDNNFYQVIRVSFSSAVSSTYEKHIDVYLNYFKTNSKSTDIKFLDIHVNNDEYVKEYESFDYINLEENYSDGVDLKLCYPEIYTSIHKVSEPEKEIQKIINNIRDSIKQKIRNKPFLIRHRYLVTYIIIGICVLNFIIQTIMKTKFSDSSSVMVFLGAEYKTFTLGLNEYYRLFTYAFVHADIIHLTCNMISLYSIGRYVEYRYGHLKYLLILFYSIVIGGLTQGILSDNSICIGISAGIYGLLVIFIIDAITSGMINLRALLPTILINLFLNFLSTTAWMAHLGGAIAGFAIYYCFQNTKSIPRIVMCVLLLLCLVFKYVTIDSIKSLYVGTDFNVVKIFDDLGLKNIAEKLLIKLMNAYSKFGG